MELRQFDIPRYLSVLPLFCDLNTTEVARLAEGCTVKRVARGEMVCRQAEPCEEFHVVVIGQVKLFVLSPLGQEKVIELVGPGNTFGEALMFSGKPYVVNVQALADTTLLVVDKKTVCDEIHREPRFAMRMLAGMSRRMHGLVNDVQAYALYSGMQRVIGYLLRDQAVEDCASGDVVTVSLPASKATIASRLSITPEYFSRVLHELEAAGLVEVDKRDVRIRDAQRLARYPMQ
jgi:CRP-like cAMP-binding protein